MPRLILLIALLLLSSCRAKYDRAERSIEQLRDDYREGRITTLDLIAHEIAHDSSRLYIREYDTLGRLSRESWLERGKVSQRSEQARGKDSSNLQASQTAHRHTATERKGDSKPDLGIPWYAWTLAIIGAVALVGLLIVIRGR